MMLVWFGLIYTHLPEKIKSGIDPCSQWGGMDAKPRSHPLRPTRAYSLAQKTVYFIGEITVKIDSRGIYSLENINYHDAYLNIPARLRESLRRAQRCKPSSHVRAPLGGATIHHPCASPHPSQHPGPDAPRSGPFSSFQFRSSGRSQQSADKAEV